MGLSTADALTDQYDTSKYVTNELRLASKLEGPVQFVAGVFQQHIKTTFLTLVATSDPAGYLNVPARTVFGQVQAPPHRSVRTIRRSDLQVHRQADGTRRRAAAFYADESDDLDSTHPFGGFSPPVATPTQYSHAHKVTPKTYLSYQVTPDAMLYGTISQGFRIGGGNLANVMPLPPQDNTYQPIRCGTTRWGRRPPGSITASS